MSFIRRSKRPKMFLLAINNDARHEKMRSPFVNDNAEKSGTGMRSGRAKILLVNTSSHGPKVDDAVVVSNAVDVINVGGRPFAMMVKPCEPVGHITRVHDHYVQVAVSLVARSGDGALFGADTRRSPREIAGFWVVVEKIAQAFCAKIGLSHDALLLLIGQRPGAMGSRCLASSF